MSPVSRPNGYDSSTAGRKNSPLSNRRAKTKPPERQTLRSRMDQVKSEKSDEFLTDPIVGGSKDSVEEDLKTQPRVSGKEDEECVAKQIDHTIPKAITKQEGNKVSEKLPSAAEQIVLDITYFVIATLICYLLVIWFYNSSSLLVL